MIIGSQIVTNLCQTLMIFLTGGLVQYEWYFKFYDFVISAAARFQLTSHVNKQKYFRLNLVR